MKGKLIQGLVSNKDFCSIKRRASSLWPFGPNSAWGSIETTTIGKT